MGRSATSWKEALSLCAEVTRDPSGENVSDTKNERCYLLLRNHCVTWTKNLAAISSNATMMASGTISLLRDEVSIEINEKTLVFISDKTRHFEFNDEITAQCWVKCCHKILDIKKRIREKNVASLIPLGSSLWYTMRDGKWCDKVECKIFSCDTGSGNHAILIDTEDSFFLADSRLAVVLKKTTGAGFDWRKVMCFPKTALNNPKNSLTRNALSFRDSDGEALLAFRALLTDLPTCSVPGSSTPSVAVTTVTKEKTNAPITPLSTVHRHVTYMGLGLLVLSLAIGFYRSRHRRKGTRRLVAVRVVRRYRKKRQIRVSIDVESDSEEEDLERGELPAEAGRHPRANV